MCGWKYSSNSLRASASDSSFFSARVRTNSVSTRRSKNAQRARPASFAT